MFTVIVLSKTAQRRFEQWKEIFLPFIEDGKIAVTDWTHPNTASDLAKAVPGLAEAVKGHDEWRLLVVGTGSEGSFGNEGADPANPFDFVGNWAVNQPEDEDHWSLNLEESPYPLVRLTHMVMGYPEMGTKSFFADPSYWDPKQQERIYESDYVKERSNDGVSEKDAKKEFTAQLPSRHDVQTHYHQDDYTEEEQRRYRELIRRYEVKQTRPDEMVLLAVRDPVPSRPTDELREAWLRGSQHSFRQRGAKGEQSRFVERNDYHPSARFVLFDRPPEDHAAYDLGELRFWLSVLSLAINDIPASSFQAERLYKVDVNVDAEGLSGALNAHLGKLAAARDHLEREVRRPRHITRLEVEEVLQPKQVSVSFDHLNGDELSIPSEGYGLARNIPTDEMGRWNDSYLQLESAVEVFNRKPKRVLAQAVEVTREARLHTNLPSELMSDIEREELEEELANRIHALASATTRDILDRGRLDELLQRQREQIRGVIRQRMSSGTIWLASGLVIFVWLAAFLPFLIQAFRGGGVAVAESFLVVLVIVGLLTSVALAVLLIMRKVLKDKIRDFNQQLRHYVHSVKAGASSFADFLSGVETYMHGRAILDEQDRLKQAGKLHQLKMYANLEVLKAAISREKSLIKSVGQTVEIRRLNQGTSEFEPWREDSLSTLLTLPVAAGQCEFNNTGEFLNAPFSFVDRLTLSSTVVREDLSRQKILMEEMTSDRPSAGEDA
ncbi:MAG TPA: hypothetical protein VGP34_04030 [Pontimonas sp.]|nr:hypothetical protein [Pontimonas sp.]